MQDAGPSLAAPEADFVFIGASDGVQLSSVTTQDVSLANAPAQTTGTENNELLARISAAAAKGSRSEAAVSRVRAKAILNMLQGKSGSNPKTDLSATVKGKGAKEATTTAAKNNRF